MNKRIVRSILIAVSATAAVIQSASAAPVTYRQYWDPAAQPDVQGDLTTTASWDDSSLTGVGIETIFLSQYTVLRMLNGVGQSFEYALLPDPADVFSLQLNTLVANYENGIFRGISVISHGGNGFVSLSLDGVNASGTGVGFRQKAADFQFLYPLPISGLWNYNLQRSEFLTQSPPPAPTTVPIPGAAVLFAFGAAMIGYVRRRKQGCRPSAGLAMG